MSGTITRALTGVVFVAVVAAATITVTAANAGTTHTGTVTARTTIGGQITRTEVLARATDWYHRRHDADVTYNQSAKAWDVGRTRQYRRDWLFKRRDWI